jgi:hypothetical protein
MHHADLRTHNRIIVQLNCKDAYASVRRYKDTVAHVDQSDLKSRFNGKILNSDLRSVARSK